jgi:hypothetical protein
MALEAHAGRLKGSKGLVTSRNVLLAAVIVALAIGAFLLINALGDDGTSNRGTLKGSSEDAFTLNYPPSWKPLSGDALAKLRDRPLAVLRRKDGKGFVIVRREKRAPKNFGAFSADLTRELERRVPDFEKRSSRIVKISAGKAFLYSYIRKRTGTVHTVVLVPAGKRSYALNTVSTGGAEDVARQVARIILSFKVSAY